MSVFDASSVIEAWDAYPSNQFPSFWKWIAELIEVGEIVVSQASHEEIGHKVSDCCDWLDTSGCRIIYPDNVILQVAMSIKADLRIVGDQYRPKAVDEADILTIATAKLLAVPLVSEESPQQPNAPINPANYRIPRVCQLPKVNVRCNNLLQYIKSSKHVF